MHYGRGPVRAVTPLMPNRAGARGRTIKARVIQRARGRARLRAMAVERREEASTAEKGLLVLPLASIQMPMTRRTARMGTLM